MNEERNTSKIADPKDIRESNSEVLIPKEEIDSIVNDFSSFYDTNLPEEKRTFKIEIIKEEEWNEKLLKTEILSAIGISDLPIKVNEETLKRFSRITIPYGEWISSENKGYLVDLSNSTWNTQTKKHIIIHELIHAISDRKDGGFSQASILGQIIKDNQEETDDYFCVLPGKLNEAATELLALGLTFKTKDLEVLGEIVEKRLLNAINHSQDENTVSDLKTYIAETLSLLYILDYVDLSLQDMCNYYLKGDKHTLITRIRDKMIKSYTKENRYSEENFDSYMEINGHLTDLGIFIELPK
jgi:hypothetical protein